MTGKRTKWNIVSTVPIDKNVRFRKVDLAIGNTKELGAVLAPARMDADGTYACRIRMEEDGAFSIYIPDEEPDEISNREPEPHSTKMKKPELEALAKTMLGDRVSTTVLCEDKPARNADHPTMKSVKPYSIFLTKVVLHSSLTNS